MLHADRPLEIMAFLDQHRWADSSVQPLQGDFSTRRYARLTLPEGKTALLMDADADQKTEQFVEIASLLRGAGISAPEIYAAQPSRGLVLMQDFGSKNVGALIDAGQDAKPYYLRATEILMQLHKSFIPASAPIGLPHYNADLFTAQAELFLDAYFPFLHKRDATEAERKDFRALWMMVLRPLDSLPKSLLLRDFMPDNLMELDNGKIGVLDFQDAGLGCVAYDLASLCEEVRRDGGNGLLPIAIDHYLGIAGNSLSQQDLLRACTILSAQRHTRILGIIAKRVLTTEKCDKLAYLPRIRNHLRTILQMRFLLPVQEWMQNYGALSDESL